MFNILVDTCVWLDVAKDPEQRPLLSVLQELINQKEVRLIVPRIVLTEIARNKSRIVEESGRSMSSVLKRAKEAVEKFGKPEKRKEALELLNDVDHKLPTFGESVNASIGQVETLLASGSVVEISDSVKIRAAERAIDKRAPFHRQRNSIDDAILIEVYADEVAAGTRDRFAFVTHNVKDFSDPTGDNNAPHPDLAPLFTKTKSRYFIKLSETVQSLRSELVTGLMLEHEEWVEEPRQLSEIVEAIGEQIDKVWYNRHKIREERIADGTIQLVDKETFPVNDHERRPIQKDIWAGALKSAAKLEKRHGKGELGPWDDFEWGMINGKLSALRWVLGEDWDELYT